MHYCRAVDVVIQGATLFSAESFYALLSSNAMQEAVKLDDGNSSQQERVTMPLETAEADLGQSLPASAVPDDWDSTDVDFSEPVSDTNTVLPEDAWMGAQPSFERVGPTTRQEDTELGIFRPDEL